MKTAVQLPTIRPSLCRQFLQSLADHPQDIVEEVHVIAQRGTRTLWEEVVDVPGLNVILDWKEQGGPVYPQRWLYAAAHPDVDVWVIADDDMEAQPETDWETMCHAVHSGKYGVVSSGWARTANMKSRFYPPRTGDWVTQAFTNTGGGMAVPKRLVPHLVAPLNDGVGLASWLYDDIQVGLTSYLLGEQPARYRGSFALHHICAGGGLNGKGGLYGELEHLQPDPRWITTSPCKPTYHNKNDIYMPNPSALTKEAKARHLEMKGSSDA
tara:strand:+ start:96 stop:899 length:804 start_codon:yes stop_codon:yes gene_type:complete